MIKTLQNTLKQDKEHLSVPKSVQDTIPIHRRPCGRKVGPNDMETNQQVSPRLRLKSMGLRQPRDCLMRSRLYQCR